LLALAARLDDRAVGLDPRFREEVCALADPDLPAGRVEGRLQRIERDAVKSAAEVAGRGGIGNPLGPEQVQISLVLPPQFEVLETGSRAQTVVGQAEHVIRFVIRQIELEERQPAVDLGGQVEFPHQQMHEADAAVGRAHRAAGQFQGEVSAA
jgi:hypothetical protein